MEITAQMDSICTIYTKAIILNNTHFLKGFSCYSCLLLFHVTIYTYYKSTYLHTKEYYNTLVIFKKLLKMLWDNVKWTEAKNFLFDGLDGVGKKIKLYLMQFLEQHFYCSNQERYYLLEQKFTHLPEQTGAII